MYNIIDNQFQNHQVRIIMIDNEPWFVAKDVAEILGYSETNKMLRRMREKNIAKVKSPILGDLTNRYGNNDIAIINEAGLYSAILGSKKPDAEKFQDWVVEDVLPSIRKTGSYNAVPQIPQTYEDALRVAANAMLEHAETLKQLTASNAVIAEQAPKVEYYNEAIDSSAVYTMSVAVKRVNQLINRNIGRTTMYIILRAKGYLSPKFWLMDDGTKKFSNEPYQQYVNQGYFVIKPGINQYAKSQTFVTAKGLQLLIDIGKSVSDIDIAIYKAQEKRERAHASDQYTLDYLMA